MRYVTGLFFTALTIFLCWSLDGKRSSAVPLALGKFLDPFHGCWQNAESKDEYQDMELESESLLAPISVVYDERRVPHVFAENDHDLYFGQGYVTARDRLWQMEFQVMAASGRLSEVIDDERVLYADRETRRRGMVFAAENGLKGMEADPIQKVTLEGYTAGVNAYINSLSESEYPLEYKLLDYAPEPWTNFKSALLLKFMAWKLTGRTYDFENSNTLVNFGWDKFRNYEMAYSDSISPIIPRNHIWPFDSVGPPPVPADSVPLEAIEAMQYQQPDPLNGSNNWAVHGSKTKNGHPILCNDPHLGMTFPSIWYEISLSTPTHTVYGASLPGSPAVISGFNQNIAWGVTNASRDVQDWYRIEFKDASREYYRYDSGWRKVETRIEEFKLRNGSILKDTVYYTHHGPIVYDASFGHSDGEHPFNLAMRWTAHAESAELKAFYLLNRGKTEADYRAALVYYECPGQNFVFASKSGDVAITQQGKFPNKWEGQGLFVMDGANPDHEWKGFIPMEQNPYVKNPERGFVSSANQHPVGPSYPYRTDGLYEWNRGRRINQALDGMNGITVEDMKQFQAESYNLMASEVLPGLLAQIPAGDLSPSAKAAHQALAGWNHFSDPKEAGPCYFKAWVRQMNKVYWMDSVSEAIGPVILPESFITVHALATTASDSADNALKAKHQGVLVASLEKVAAEMENWKQDHPGEELIWLNYNNARVIHLVRQPALSRTHIPIGGDVGVVSAVKGGHGPSWRMVVELGDSPNGFGVYPGGQSGNPGSYWYDNMIDQWAMGKYYPLNFYTNPEAAAPSASSTLNFKPE